jgi:TolB-like protein/DNA-binding winged helix-turn-helix (wHTH) protein
MAQEPQTVTPVIRFGVFELDLAAGELRKSGIKVRLQEQPFQILSLLLERPGQVVTRDEIQQKLWPDGTFVDFEHSLNAAVKRLREALEDSADNPQFVETVPRRGYRFIYPVEGHAARSRRWVWALALAALPALLTLLLALNVGGLRDRLWPRADSPAKRIMLAVLPCDNLSGDPEQEYFSDGMTDEMIAQLGRLQPARLGVIARTSAMHYKGTDKHVDEIGRELGVEYILECSVRREGDRVRITAQLIQVSDQTHLWAASYERELAGIFAIQSEVSRQIARSLEVELLPAERARPSGAGTINPEAYEAYLKGRYFWNKRTEEGIKKSLDYFQQAVARDPDYALAYSGLADAYLVGIFVGYLPSQDNHPKGLAAALRAVELDDTLAEAHASLANFEIGNWLVEEKELKRAIELNPNYAPARIWYAMHLSARGRHEEALAEGKKALELDPGPIRRGDRDAPACT